MVMIGNLNLDLILIIILIKSQNNKIESESESKTKNSLNLFDDDDNISFEEIFKPIENIETKKNEINKQNRIIFIEYILIMMILLKH